MTGRPHWVSGMIRPRCAESEYSGIAAKLIGRACLSAITIYRFRAVIPTLP